MLSHFIVINQTGIMTYKQQHRRVVCHRIITQRLCNIVPVPIGPRFLCCILRTLQRKSDVISCRQKRKPRIACRAVWKAIFKYVPPFSVHHPPPSRVLFPRKKKIRALDIGAPVEKSRKSVKNYYGPSWKNHLQK